MGMDRSAVALAAGDDDPDGGSLWVPSTFAGDASRQPSLPIDRPNEILHIHELGLELDDEQCSSRGMPGEDVDDAALAEDRERHLGSGDPLGQVAEEAGELLVHRAVTGVEESIELAAAPPGQEHDPDIEGGRRPPQRVEREAPDVTAFDPRDGRSMDPCPRGHVLLTERASDANGTHRAAESLIVHARIMSLTAPALITGAGR